MDHTQIILNELEQLLSLLDISAELSVEIQDEYYSIQVDTEETGVLIGYHGETLAALQTILSQILFNKTQEWVKINLNIGDYLEKREEQLHRIADKAVDQALHEQKSVTLPPLTPKERRIIHLYLKEKQTVETESIGEGGERRLVVFPA